MFLKFNYSRQGTPHFPDSKSNIFSKSATIFIFYHMIFNVDNKNKNCTKERKSRFYNVIHNFMRKKYVFKMITSIQKNQIC